MKDDLNIALGELIKSILDAKDFAIEQAPDVIHQLIQFTIFSNLMGMFVSLFVFWVSYKCTFKWSNQEIDSSGDWLMSKFVSGLLGGIASFVSFFVFLASLTELLKVLLAPKLFLLEYAASLIK